MIKFKPLSLWLILLTAAICSLNISCKKVSVDLGSDFVDNSTTNLAFVDSPTVEISTIYVDSFVTSGQGVILAGRYKDPSFGNISSSSFIQLGVPPATTIPNGAMFDSMEVVLRLNKTYYGDTLSPYTIAVNQLTNAITLPIEQYAFYNRDKINYNATALGSTSLIIRPSVTDSITIPVSNLLGQELFDKLATSDPELTQNDLFIDYFKGLAITSGVSNNLIMGFKDSLIMRLHYRNPGVINTDAYLDFSINNNANQFNNITADRSGTLIASLGPNNRQIFSPQAQNAGFSQYITGAMAKVSIPYLRDLLQLNNFVKLIKAELILKPVKNSFSGYYTLPPSLRLSQTDQYNVPGTDLSAYSSTTGTAAIEYGNLFIDNLYGTETAYTYDITSYLQSQIIRTDYNKNGLLVLPPNPSVIFNRVMIGDKYNAESKSQVKIYYATVK